MELIAVNSVPWIPFRRSGSRTTIYYYDTISISIPRGVMKYAWHGFNTLKTDNLTAYRFILQKYQMKHIHVGKFPCSRQGPNWLNTNGHN
jgi:hypothetical protein